jgi:type IV pilus assembly protein PilE
MNRARGFTLTEVLVTTAIVAIFAAVAWPLYQGQLARARRTDAVAALTGLQAAQERLRSIHGYYSSDFTALRLPPTSGAGLYALAIELGAPDSYRATATALAGGAQQRDSACPQLVLQVRSGFAEVGPSAGCWNR